MGKGMRNIVVMGMLAALLLTVVPGSALAGGFLPDNPNRGVAYSTGDLRTIYLAGGCFWGVEAFLARIYGVADAVSGYANGNTKRPTYEDVSYKNSGHAETVMVKYDPAKVSLEELLRRYLRIIDPTSLNKQGYDEGVQYRTGIYYTEEGDKAVIEKVLREEQGRYSRPVVVEALPLRNFYRAEEMHQNYLEKQMDGYCHVDFSELSGDREAIFVDPSLYQKPEDAILRQRLTALQYAVTQRNFTEAPYTSEYDKLQAAGLYVDIVTGEPLFSSGDKFESGTGWPSFVKPVSPEVVVEKADHSYGMDRTEVRSRVGDSHLGHVFADGPRERGSLRYCINGAALRFIPVAELEAAGYGGFRALFE